MGDCRLARGMQPIGNVKKFRSAVPDVVKKTAAKSFFANRSMLGLEDEDSMDKMEISPPPLSPQAPPVHVTTPPASPPYTPQHQAPVSGKLGKSPLSPDIE